MKKNQHKLDDFLKEKVEETDFRMPDGEWQRMSAMLDEQDTKKRGAWWKSWLMIALIGLISLGAFLGRAWLQFHQTDAPKLSDNRIESSPTNENRSQNTSSDKQQHIEAVTESQNNPTATIENQSHPSATTEKKSDNDKHPSKPSPLQNSKHQSVNTPKSALVHTPLSHQQQAQDINNKPTSPESISVPSTVDKAASHSSPINPTPKSKYHKRTETSESDTQSSISPERSGKKKIQQKIHSLLIRSGKGLEPQAQKESNESNNNPSNTVKNTQIVNDKPMLALDTEQYVQRRHRDETQYNPRYVNGLENYTATELDSITVITYQPVVEKSTSKSSAPSDITHTDADSMVKFKSAVNHSLNWYLLGGLSLNKGFQGTSASNTLHVSPYIGLGAQVPLSARLQMAAHIGFTYFSGLQTSETVTSYQYSFGIDSSSFQVQYQKLLQVYIPLSLQYAVTHKQAISLQLGAMYNADVMSKITESTWSVNNGYGSLLNRNGTNSSKQSSGYRNGFQSFDIIAGLGYQYQINDHLQWQMMLQQGMLDMTRNAYFKQNQSDKQTRLLIGVRYTFKRS